MRARCCSKVTRPHESNIYLYPNPRCCAVRYKLQSSAGNVVTTITSHVRSLRQMLTSTICCSFPSTRSRICFDTLVNSLHIVFNHACGTDPGCCFVEQLSFKDVHRLIWINFITYNASYIFSRRLLETFLFVQGFDFVLLMSHWRKFSTARRIGMLYYSSRIFQIN